MSVRHARAPVARRALRDPARPDRGRVASLIETAKVSGVERFADPEATLAAIAGGHPQSRIDDLLPRTFQPSS